MMGRTCPWCLEPVPSGRSDAETCPRCLRPLRDEEGRELTALDLRFERVEARQCERFPRVLTACLILVAGWAAVVPVTLPTGAVTVPVVVAMHLILIRLVLVGDALRLQRPARRLIARWILRLGFLWLGGLGYAAALAPLVGILPAAGTAALLTTFAHHYVVWGLRSGREGRGVASWEKVVLVVLAAATVIGLLVAVAAAALLGWGLSWVAGQL